MRPGSCSPGPRRRLAMDSRSAARARRRRRLAVRVRTERAAATRTMRASANTPPGHQAAAALRSRFSIGKRPSARNGCAHDELANVVTQHLTGFGSGLLARPHPPRKELDFLRGPRAVTGHRATAQTLEDTVRVGADVLIGPEVEVEPHGLTVLLAGQVFDVGGKLNRYLGHRSLLLSTSLLDQLRD